MHVFLTQHLIDIFHPYIFHQYVSQYPKKDYALDPPHGNGHNQNTAVPFMCNDSQFHSQLVEEQLQNFDLI